MSSALRTLAALAALAASRPGGSADAPTEAAPAVVTAPPAAAPPVTPGIARTTVTGCALAKDEAEARRSVVRGPPRDPAARLAIAPAPHGATVTHHVEHACCLAAETSLRFEGRTAIVQERFSGTPCRCRCETTLVTEVGLPRGDWEVEVVVDVNNRMEKVGRATVGGR